MSYELYKKQCEVAGPARLAFYEKLIKEGNNPGFAAMLALQSPAGTKGTERAFLEGMHNWAGGMNPENRKLLFEKAHKAGVSTQGKKYIGGLGKPDDQMAWVSTMDDVKAVCKEKGYSCEGAVDYQAPEQKFEKKRMAEDVVGRFMHEAVAKDPDIKHNKKAMKELRAKVVKKHSKENLK